MRREPDKIYGGINIINPCYSSKKDKRDAVAKYDRISFYPTEFLKMNRFPNLHSMEPINEKDSKDDFTIIKFDVVAMRKHNRLGLFISRQREVIMENNIYMFLSEFNKVFRKEFDIHALKNVQFLKPSSAKVDKDFRSHISKLYYQKRKLDNEPFRRAEREQVKRLLILPIVSCAKTANNEFDRMSLAYLQSMCRIKMYRTMCENYHLISSVFADEISVINRIPRLEKNKEWRTSWLKQ